MLKQINLYLKLMRLHQPTGIFLLLWPSLIGLSLASTGYPDLFLSIILIIGSIVMRSAGCIFNDIIDYKFDQKVERTKNRPLASGKISRNNALKLLAFLLIIAVILLFFLNKTAIIISLISIPLIIIYPFCKRYTYWAQLWLGITFNIGCLVGWASVKSSIETPAIFLYIAFIFWTLGYDTIYAHQDRIDDLTLGLKSTAINFGEKTAKYVNFFYTITVTFIIFAFGTVKGSLHFYAVVSLPIMLLFWQASTLDINDSKNCSIRFKINTLVGGLIFLASLAFKV